MYDYRLSPSLFYIHLLLFLLFLLVAIAPFLTPPPLPLYPDAPSFIVPGPQEASKTDQFISNWLLASRDLKPFALRLQDPLRSSETQIRKLRKLFFFSFLKFDCSPISKSLLERSNRKQKRSSSEWGWFVISFVASIKRDQVQTYLEQN